MCAGPSAGAGASTGTGAETYEISDLPQEKLDPRCAAKTSSETSSQTS